MYAHSNELDETGIINLNGAKVETNPDMESLLGVSVKFVFLGNFSNTDAPLG